MWLQNSCQQNCNWISWHFLCVLVLSLCSWPWLSGRCLCTCLFWSYVQKTIWWPIPVTLYFLLTTNNKAPITCICSLMRDVSGTSWFKNKHLTVEDEWNFSDSNFLNVISQCEVTYSVTEGQTPLLGPMFAAWSAVLWRRGENFSFPFFLLLTEHHSNQRSRIQ